MSLTTGLVFPLPKKEVGIDITSRMVCQANSVTIATPPQVCCHGNTTPVVLTLTGLEPPVVTPSFYFQRLLAEEGVAALTWISCPGCPRPTGDLGTRGTSYTMLVLAPPSSQVPS